MLPHKVTQTLLRCLLEGRRFEVVSNGEKLFIEAKMGEYATGAAAVQFVIDATDEPWGTFTVSLAERDDSLAPGEFFAKTWSENESWAGAIITELAAEGLIEVVGESPAGHVQAPRVTVTPDGAKAAYAKADELLADANRRMHDVTMAYDNFMAHRLDS